MDRAEISLAPGTGGGLKGHVPIADDGSFVAVGLPAGSHRVMLLIKLPTPGGSGYYGTSLPLGNVQVDPEHEARLELDTSRYLPGSLQARLVIAPALLREASIGVWPRVRDNQNWPLGHMGMSGYAPDQDNQITVPVLLPGEYEITLGFGGLRNSFVVCPDPIVIAPGEKKTVVVEVPQPRLRIRVLTPDGTPLGATECKMERYFFFDIETKTDAEGWVVLDPAPCVPLKLSVPGKGSADVPAAAGKDAEIEIRLSGT